MAGSIEIEGLTKSFSGHRVVNGLSLDLSCGEIVGLLGPNGAGKTTTFYMIVGLIKPDSGIIRFDGRDIGNLPIYKRAEMGIGYLPQEASVFRRLSVRDNIAAVFEVKGLRRSEITEETERIIEEFKLGEITDKKGGVLSGGQRRRVEIARAIAIGPTFLLFDEPFAGIDPIVVAELKELLLYLKRRSIGILITDHNVRETLSITDRAYIISHGEVLDSGTPERLAKNPEVRRAYLGEGFRL